jgi:acetyltransferase-like isoleucine patch superfamily enzyme
MNAILAKIFRFNYRNHLKKRGAQIFNDLQFQDKFVYGNPASLYIGKATYFESGVKINIGENQSATPQLKIGSRVFINSYSMIDCHYKIEIGDCVLIGPYVYIADFNHSTDPQLRQQKINTYAPVHIEDNVWIGAHAIILKGVTIGKNSVIAAGAFVNSNIPSNTIASGNPAKVIKQL